MNRATQTEIANLRTPLPPPLPTSLLPPTTPTSLTPDSITLNQTELHLAAARGDVRTMTTLIQMHPGEQGKIYNSQYTRMDSCQRSKLLATSS